MTLLFKPFIFLAKYIAGIVFALALIAGVVWALNRPRPQWEVDAAMARTPPPGWTPPAVPAQWVTPPMTQKELQALIVDFYHVETSQFIRPDLLHVSFAQGESEPQKKCQAIANIWSFRGGLNNVMVECWAGQKRLGFGTVVNGKLVDP